MNTELGRILYRARLAKNYSLTELGQQIGVSHMTIHRYESGDRVPPPEVRRNLSQVLGIPLGTLEDAAQKLSDLLSEGK